MQIVSNTSPLIILKKSSAIFILEKLFDSVLVPNSVQNELFKKERKYFSRVKFLRVEGVKDESTSLRPLHLRWIRERQRRLLFR